MSQAGFLSIVQDDREFLILLPPTLQYWEYICATRYPSLFWRTEGGTHTCQHVRTSQPNYILLLCLLIKHGLLFHILKNIFFLLLQMYSAGCTDDLYIFKMKLDLGLTRANRVDSGWANVMVHWTKVLLAKSDNLSSFTWDLHGRRRDITDFQKLSSDLHMCTMNRYTFTHVHMHAHICI